MKPKKLLALVLSLAMIISTLPMKSLTVFAASYDMSDDRFFTVTPQVHIYNGKMPEFTVVYTPTGKELVQNVDYTVEAETDNFVSITPENPDGAKFYKFTGMGEFSGSFIEGIKIVACTTPPDITLTETTVHYDGEPKTPSVIVTLNGETVETADYEVSYSDNTAVGTATVTITGKRNFDYTTTRTFEIAEHVWKNECCGSDLVCTYAGCNETMTNPRAEHEFSGTACLHCDFVCENHDYGSDRKCTICGTELQNYIPVNDITIDCGETIIANRDVRVTATAYPENRTVEHIEFTFEIEDAGETQANESELSNQVTELFALSGGTLKLKVTANDGYTTYSETFTIQVNYIQVTDVDGTIPTELTMGDVIELPTGTIPADISSSFKTVGWEIVSGPAELGTDGKTLTVTGAGTIQLEGYVSNGLDFGQPFVKTCSITAKLPRETLDETLNIGTGSIVISKHSETELKILYNSKEIIANAEQLIPITGSSSANTITIQSGAPYILLKDCTLQNIIGRPVIIESGAAAEITLEGANVLTVDTDGIYRPAIHVPAGASLTIDGSGSLQAVGGIESAGIGGGSKGAGSMVTISGGTVTAKGGSNGAGIGGGYSGAGGTVSISGGNVKATGGSYATAIGKGYNGSSDGTLTNGTESVSRVILTLNGAAAGTEVSVVSGLGYGINDVKTLDTNKLYFYLPSGAEASSITAGGQTYFCKDSSLTYYKSHDWSNKDGVCAHCGATCSHEGQTGTVCGICGYSFHTHQWTYAAEDDTIIATCNSTDGTCPVANNTVTITLTAPKLTTYGGTESAAAMVTVDPADVLVISDVVYKTQSGAVLDNAPTDAGTYIAGITMGEGDNAKTAKVEYTISEATPEVTAPVAIPGLIYSGSEQTLITAGSATNGTMQYKLGENGTYGTAIPTATDAGTYTVYYKVIGNANYKDVAEQSIPVTIGRAEVPAVSFPWASSITYGQSLKDVPLNEGTTEYLDFEWKDANVYPDVGDVQSYEMLGKPKDLDNYDWSTVKDYNASLYFDSNLKAVIGEVFVNVEKAKFPESEVTAPVAKTDLVYNGEAQELVIPGETTIGTMQYRLGGTNIWSADIPTATDSGSYDVNYKVTDKNYEDSKEGSVRVYIGDKPLTEENVQLIPASTPYNGQEQKPQVVVKDGGKVLVEGTDYNVGHPGTDDYTNCMRTMFHVSAAGSGNYSGSFDLTYTITPIAPVASDFEFTAPNSLVYDGNAKEASIRENLSGNKTGIGGITAVTYYKDGEKVDAAVDVGTYTVKIDVASGQNYIAAVSLTDESWTFTITPAKVTKPTADKTEFVYNGSEQTYAVAENDNYTVTGNKRTDAGKQVVTVSLDDKANYTWDDGTTEDLTFTFNIATLDITNAVITLGDALTYNGSEQTQTIASVKVDGLDVTYTVTDDKATNYNAEGYELTVTANGNFSGTKTASWSIAKKKIDSAIVLTAPVKNTAPQTEIKGTGYTAAVVWSPEVTDKFGYNKEYTATITITTDDNHTVEGIAADGYTVEGAKTVTNDENSNVVTAAYEKTGSRSSSGGRRPSSSNTTTVTTKNEDDSVTKTTTDETTETKTEVTTGTDGSTTTVETQKDGTVTTTEKDSEGNKTVTTEKADGTVITEETKKDGTTVKTETTASGETTAEVKAKGETEVVIPVENADEVTKVIVTDKDGNETEVEFAVKDGGIAVSVSGNSAVSVQTGHTCYAKDYTDVDTDSWYHLNIDYVLENGLMKGTAADRFAPNGIITRAMMVTVLYRAEGEPTVTGTATFEDVDTNAYYAKAVVWGQQNGIIKGYSETEFAPDQNITREQIAAIMHRYAQYKGYDVSVGENTNILSYSDYDSISEYAIASMQYAVGSGILRGKTASTLNPKDNAARAEIAAILNRFIEANK